ncbi:hypothetical protein E9840_11230 [Tissierella creatinini]|nr:hypothetical protein E9840_11230 [Tissierella creatinini]TJX62907.1 hypothetical protein E8P77_16285 [Soehngenia saccharolytica]
MEEKLQELLKEEFEEVTIELREEYAHPLQIVKFQGLLLSPEYTEYTNSAEGVYLTPKGQFFYFSIDEDTEVGEYTVYPDFESFKRDGGINKDLYFEVAYEIGYEGDTRTVVLDI